MARHRALLRAARRGVARWPVVTLGTVLVLLVCWLGWRHVDVVSQRQAAVQAASCPEGDAVLTIAVSPPVAEVVKRAAATWTRSRPVVHDHCIRAEVVAMPPQTVLQGLSSGWDAGFGPRPTAWLPESSLWVNRLADKHAKLLGSQPESIATSPVVLAMPELAAASFGTDGAVRWGELPALVAAPDGWARFGRPDWGRFTLALPDVAQNPATALALQSMLVGQGGPLTADRLTASDVTTAMSTLASATPPSGPASTEEAVTTLAAAEDVRTAPFDAVPVLEYELYLRNVGQDDEQAMYRPLIGVPLGGPTPVADYPFVALSGDGVPTVLVRAAQQFRELLQSAPQQLELAKVGLRVPGSKVHPTPAPGMHWADVRNRLAPADAAAARELSTAWVTAGGRGQVLTVLVDVSSSMGSRLDHVKTSLTDQVNRLPSGSLGLWQFSDGPRRLVDAVAVSRQRAQLLREIAGLQPQTASHLYPSVLAVYESALRNYQQDRQNRLVLITDGPDDSPMTEAEFTRELTGLRDGSPPLPISVLAVGPDPDSALPALADSTGGSYRSVTDGTEIGPALAQLLDTG